MSITYSSLNSDSDQDSDSEKRTFFLQKIILPYLFQLKTSKKGAIGQDDNNSLGTMATGASNATWNIIEELAKAGTIDCVDNSTYVSGLTETTCASPTAKSPPG